MNGDVDDLKLKVADALTVMRSTKTDRVREQGLDANVHPQVVVWRRGVPIAVAVMSPHDVTSPRVRMFADMVVRGLRADVAVLSYEGWVRTGPTSAGLVNPDTGRPWATGEMSDYHRRHGRDGVLGEGFVAHAVSLLAAVHGMQHVTPRASAFGDTVDYGETHLDDMGAVTGDMVSAIRASLQGVPELAARQAEDARATGMDEHPVAAEALADATIVRLLVEGQWGHVALMGDPADVERWQALTRTLGQPPATSFDDLGGLS